MVDRLPSLFLRIEGSAVLVAALVLYFELGYEWWLLVPLLLAPDLSMLGFLAGQRVGTAVYDIAHLQALPLALAVGGYLGDSEVALKLGLIWLAHIGMDRAVGYGLKYPTNFKDTHLQRV